MARFILTIALLSGLVTQNLWAAHALDPLTKEELGQAAKVLRSAKRLGDGFRLQHLSNLEPAKVAGVYPDPADAPRHALAVVLHARRNLRYEIDIDLAKGKVASERAIAAQPAVLDAEYGEVREALKRDPRVQAALKKRGFEVLSQIFADIWAPGNLAQEGVDQSHRYLRAMFYWRGDAKNSYARPLEGLTALYDATLGQVVKVDDSGVVPVQPNKHDFFTQSDSAVAPAAIQTNPAIQVKGQEVNWRGWRFHFMMHPREGLVLYKLGRVEEGRFRSILDRASLSEMVVPYADPSHNWHWRAAFDQGDYGMGIYANSLLRGVHFPAHGLTFDADFAGNDGEIETHKDVVAIFERDNGMLWSHYEPDANQVAAKGAKELVVLFVFTVGNYDYGVQWVLREDGTIRSEALLTGVLLTQGKEQAKCLRCSGKASVKEPEGFGALVDQNLVAVFHQHFFNWRLDFAIEKGPNSIAEINLEPVNDLAANPHGNAFRFTEQVLKNERAAIRDHDHNSARHWLIFNPNQKNRLGHYNGYVLEPSAGAPFALQPSAHTRLQAPFLAHPLHVTRYHPSEMHAAGDYPNQNQGEGLPVWVGSREVSIENEDLVVWYTLGVSHMPTVEDWPVMPVHRTGFVLKPMGFFERNPSLNGY